MRALALTFQRHLRKDISRDRENLDCEVRGRDPIKVLIDMVDSLSHFPKMSTSNVIEHKLRGRKV